MKQDLIENLISDKNIYAECSICGESFPLHKAAIFYADGKIPEKAAKIIERLKEDLNEREKLLTKSKKKLKEKVGKATRSINIGKNLERIAPVLEGFEFSVHDCRTLFDPIDYLVFDGLSRRNGIVDHIHFVEIKTGGAGLTKRQRQIRDAVEGGNVKWDQLGGYDEK